MKRVGIMAAVMLSATGIAANARCIGACGMMEGLSEQQDYYQQVANHAYISKRAFKLDRKLADQKHDAVKELLENAKEIKHRQGLMQKFASKLMNAEIEASNAGRYFNMYEPPQVQTQMVQPTGGLRYYQNNQWQGVNK